MAETVKKFGTAPVFFTAMSTILGAILFLRFGYAVGTVGFIGVIFILILGHMVTIPTSLAISELATNKRVEGGGEYFIISRSFGLNIGATIGIALYLSQAISVAFYVIAFTETFQFFFDYLEQHHGFILPRQAISVPVMLLLSVLILKKGANLGVKAIYFVVAILATSIVLFFLGDPSSGNEVDFDLANAQFRNIEQFYLVFAIIFPAFTGMTAGVGLSGDLKNPSRSIPFGTVTATILGMIIYLFISLKLANSASPEALTGNQFVMSEIALWGWLCIPLGLAASTISSALGSVMVAPRTLQALANDQSFPIKQFNGWLSRSRDKDAEPFNASLVTCMIAMVFVILGNVDIVAQIISMFFMITYGSLCLISFLNHFGSSPSYRPSFKSKWYISLIGAITSVWVMFKISVVYGLFAFAVMILLYFYINNIHRHRKGISSIFTNTIFQVNRNLQLYLQKRKVVRSATDWRPSVICLSKNSFDRDNAFRLTNWISYKYGFGTYLHRIEEYCSKSTFERSNEELTRLIHNYGDDGHVYIDTIISPSYTSAIAHAIQIPSISGMENNMLILEYDKEEPEELADIIDNFKLINSGNFDVCILASSRKPIIFKNGIHIWIKTTDAENANLMIILSFILLGHPNWRNSDIRIFDICKPEEVAEVNKQMNDLIEKGRLPITPQNIKILVEEEGTSYKSIINAHSVNAGLTIMGFHEDSLRLLGVEAFEGYEDLGNILFVNSYKHKLIE
ncbi:amino acid permease [Robertkochia marina]|uniref:Amino acid permease n=1 Tax=Robertkochia marina TaxID=1227945 RepID=A0A4S3M1P8_9FLAO|nr:amino acid permease [Robertkochia marina]THD67385.1 amino acid permease [Robertkochia marina]TRZ43039.1 amino acid permease [Robertkochia marina]